jgi:hypothetical protein
MHTPDNKIDAAMQAYAKKWMNSLELQRPSTSLGYFFVGLFLLFWSSSLTTLLGYDLKQGFGVLIFVGVGLTLTLVTILVNKIMAKIGLNRSIRSALWLSAVIGPYVNLTTYYSWNVPVLSHISGFAAAILSFLFSTILDKFLEKKPIKADRN